LPAELLQIVDEVERPGASVDDYESQTVVSAVLLMPVKFTLPVTFRSQSVADERVIVLAGIEGRI